MTENKNCLTTFSESFSQAEFYRNPCNGLGNEIKLHTDMKVIQGTFLYFVNNAQKSVTLLDMTYFLLLLLLLLLPMMMMITI
jgi:hypothetical protein